MAKPFAGLRVVDFTQVVAGPYTTFQLALLGADVVKIEQPGTGDQGRRLMAPTPEVREAGMSALFSAVNSGKRSLTLDLKKEEAKSVVERLVSNADVVVENFKAGTMARLSLPYERLKRVNPRLVYCAISGYGQGGPRSEAAAYDPVVQASSGIMSVTGTETSGPTKVGFWVVDMATGLHAAFAIAAALVRRGTTGEGEYIDVAMLDTAVSLMSPLVGLFANYGVEPPFTGNGTPGAGGASTVYPTQDGHLTIAAATDSQFAAFAREIGKPEMASDERFATREARLANPETYRAAVIEGLSSDTARRWEQRLAKVGVPASKNQSVAEVVADPQIAHRKVLQTLPAPSGLEGSFTAVNLGFHMGKDGPRPESPPPKLGAHSDEILREVGYDEEEINRLRTEGIV